MLRSSILSSGTTQMIAWCPDGAVYNPIQKICTTSHYAIGPFSKDMQKSCENVRGAGSYDCQQDNWDIYFAGVLRGASECQPGTSLNEAYSACTDNSFAYGPFTAQQVSECKSLNWGYVCEVMRWPLDVLKGIRAPDGAVPIFSDEPIIKANPNTIAGFRGRLLSYYSNPQNYRKVQSDVMNWFGTTSNACVAFLTTAMRHSGLAIPRKVNSKGYNISTWTAALSEYLEGNLAWQRIGSMRELLPGDVVFTLDLDGSRGTPAHVFLFVEWADQSSTWARVVDNQGFLHKRDLSAHSGGNFTPFQYALRPPQ